MTRENHTGLSDFVDNGPTWINKQRAEDALTVVRAIYLRASQSKAPSVLRRESEGARRREESQGAWKVCGVWCACACGDARVVSYVSCERCVES